MPEAPTWEALLEPVGLAKFLRDHWERRPLALTGRPRSGAPVLTVEELGRVVADHVLVHPALRVVRDEVPVPAQRWLREVAAPGGGRMRVADGNRVAAEYEAGATVVLPAVHRHVPAVGALCRQLEAESGFDVQANAYLTPPWSVGFGVHWDSHDVVVLQSEGSKRWLVGTAPSVEAPDPEVPCDPATIDPTQPFTEHVLEPGDLLYLPAGVAHQAFSGDSPSLHLSVTVKPTTRADAARAALEDAIAGTPHLRRGLPFGWSVGDPAAAVADAADAVALAAGTAAPAAAVEALATRFVMGRRAPSRHPFAPVGDVPPAKLRRAPGCAMRVAADGDGIEVVVPGRRLRAPHELAVAVREMLSGEPFDPGAYVDERVRVLAEQLRAAGAVDPAP